MSKDRQLTITTTARLVSVGELASLGGTIGIELEVDDEPADDHDEEDEGIIAIQIPCTIEECRRFGAYLHQEVEISVTIRRPEG